MTKKKKLIPTKRKRMKDKESADMLTIQLLMMIDELHKHKGTVVSIPSLIKKLNNENNGHN